MLRRRSPANLRLIRIEPSGEAEPRNPTSFNSRVVSFRIVSINETSSDSLTALSAYAVSKAPLPTRKSTEISLRNSCPYKCTHPISNNAGTIKFRDRISFSLHLPLIKKEIENQILDNHYIFVRRFPDFAWHSHVLRQKSDILSDKSDIL